MPLYLGFKHTTVVLLCNAEMLTFGNGHLRNLKPFVSRSKPFSSLKESWGNVFKEMPSFHQMVLTIQMDKLSLDGADNLRQTQSFLFIFSLLTWKNQNSLICV